MQDAGVVPVRTGRPDQRTLLAFAALIVAAGGNSVAIRYTYEELRASPFWSATIRFSLATLLFAVIAGILRVPVPRGRALIGALLYGTLFFGVGFGLIYRGLVDAPAGLAQTLLACIPLLTLLLAVAQRQERFRWDGLAGAALAAGGMTLIFRGAVDQDVPLKALLLIVAGAVCWAEAGIVIKAFPPVHPAMMNAVGNAAGVAILLSLSIGFGESRPLPETARTWTAQVYLVLIGSIAVFTLYLFVLRRWTASAASYQFPLYPLVTVVLSAWLLDEKITGAFAFGAILVLLGVYLGALRDRRVKPA